MKTPVAIWLSALVLATLVFVACGGGTTSDTPINTPPTTSSGDTPTETPASVPQVSDGTVESLSQELLEVELEDVDLSEALSNIAEILDSLDPDLFDLSALGLDETLIDVSVLLDAGADVDLGFDQVNLGQ